MSAQYLGEIKMFGGNFAPRGFAFCNGQLLSISQNSALFSLLGTTYGGNGSTTFGLPDLQGRFPMHWGNGAARSARQLGETGGAETVTLTAAQLPQHTHSFSATAAPGCQNGPGGFDTPGTHVPAISANAENYATAPGNATMAPITLAGTTAAAGSGAAAPNMPPFQCVSFIISLEGIFPSRS